MPSRPLLDRLALKLRGAFRLLLAAVMMLRPSSRLRRFVLTDLVRRGYVALNRRDYDVALMLAHPGFECLLPSALVDQAEPGREGFRQWWESIDALYETWSVEPEEIIFLDGSRILVLTRWDIFFPQSEIQMVDPGGEIFHFERGWWMGLKAYSDRDEAFAEAGYTPAS